jgi:hypothetical protein
MKMKAMDLSVASDSGSMHAEILREVRQDIAALKERLEKLLAVEAYHAEKVGTSHISNGVAGEKYSNGHRLTDSVAASKQKPPGRFAGLGQREAAIAMLREAGKPLRCGEIARGIKGGGYDFPHDAILLANSLSTSFRRCPKVFRKAGRGLWALKDPQASAKASPKE